MDLGDYRKKIDELDEVLCDAFVKRMECCKKIGEIKAREGLPILNQGREQEVIDKATKGVSDELKPYVTSFVKEMMALSREYQK